VAVTDATFEAFLRADLRISGRNTQGIKAECQRARRVRSILWVRSHFSPPAFQHARCVTSLG
jgi:hypothetical protein